MRLRDAKKLENRDEVMVRNSAGKWEYGYVLGSPRLENPKFLMIPVQSKSDGFREVCHLDIR